MSWTYQSSVSASSGGTDTCSVTLPATILAGDVLIAGIYSNGAATLTTVPAGWVRVAGNRAAYKIADGTEDGSSAAFVFSAAGAHVTRVTRATPSTGNCTFVEAGAANGLSGSTTVTLSSASGDLFLSANCGAAVADTIATPSGYTNIGSSTSNPCNRFAYLTQTGGTPAVTFTYGDTTTQHYATLVAFRDGAAAAAPNNFFFGSH